MAFSCDAARFAPSASCANSASSIAIIMDTVILAVSIFVSVLVLLVISLLVLVLLVLVLLVLLITASPGKKQTDSFPLARLRVSAAA